MSAQPVTDRADHDQELRHWRSLTEQADPASARQYLARVEAALAPSMTETTRRNFLRILGASLALATTEGCRNQPAEKIVPYVRQPEQIVPGVPLYFATCMTIGGVAAGLLVESHMGRPTKIEGNPRHPDVPAIFWTGDPTKAPGVSDIVSQAAILGLYDPERSQTVTRAGQISTWDAFVTALEPELKKQRDRQGSGIRLLSETISSPSQADMIRRLLTTFPQARWTQFDPINADNARAGAQAAFGRSVDTHIHVDKADVILSLDSDFLVAGPAHLRHAADFAARRDVTRAAERNFAMNRLYAAESTLTLTGAKADHRIALRPSLVEELAVALAIRLGVDVRAATRPSLPDDVRHWLDVVADDLRQARGENDESAALVVAGPWLSPRVHALVHAVNAALGAVGRTITYTEPVAVEAALQYPALRQLAQELRDGKVELLCILGGNPAYASPADIDFAGSMQHAPLRIRLGLYDDETSALCDWHIPAAHPLEAWDDGRSTDGTVSFAQPLIAPLYEGKTAAEVLSALLGQPGRTAYNIVKEYWRAQAHAPENFEVLWQTSLHDGVMANTALETLAVTPRAPANANETNDRQNDQLTDDEVELVLRPDPTLYDGRFANNGWLQELPKPFTKLTWGNAALIAPALAARLGLKGGDVIELRDGERSIETPICVTPGLPDRVVTLHLGGGRQRGAQVAAGVGVNVYALQSSASPWRVSRAKLRSHGRRETLACTQSHHWMNSRDLIRTGTLAEARENPAGFAPREETRLTTLYPPHEYNGHKWGMTIDLNRCTGCNACVLACQAENNIPVVGREQVERGREMHWIRVDTYYEGDTAAPQVAHQPVPCMHCENAPCEVVCPVGATVHDNEGLNEMVYNRCVGTRYCSNNCPYKVRRFNFLQYSDLTTPTLKLLRNPEVTVRNRGVMEKCTYCIQRISAARIQAELRDGAIEDGQLASACQAACPSQAITFGDLNDSGSRVARLAADPLNYALLAELNTRPRTTYLPVVRNPNPALTNNDRSNL